MTLAAAQSVTSDWRLLRRLGTKGVQFAAAQATKVPISDTPAVASSVAPPLTRSTSPPAKARPPVTLLVHPEIRRWTESGGVAKGKEAIVAHRLEVRRTRPKKSPKPCSQRAPKLQDSVIAEGGWALLEPGPNQHNEAEQGGDGRDVVDWQTPITADPVPAWLIEA